MIVKSITKTHINILKKNFFFSEKSINFATDLCVETNPEENNNIN